MADSYRLTVLKRLTALLEGIVPSTEPTLTDMTGRVFRGRAVFGDNDPRTMLSILESPRPAGANEIDHGQARNEQWSLLIQGWTVDDKEHPSDPVYALADEVERRLDRITRSGRGTGEPLYPEHYMLGAALDGDGYLITGFSKSAPVVRPPTPNVSERCFFYLPVQVGLARIST